MTLIKHISFDLWLTLIKSHPEFKQKRSQLLLKTFGLEQHYSTNEIDARIRSIDKIFDRYNEVSGKKVSALTMYEKIIKKIVPDKNSISNDCIIDFRKKADELFLEYPPQFLNDNIALNLINLQNEGFTLNISSNTGFIEGSVLRIVLDQLDISKYFNFLIFSDEVEVSKPSSHFFQKVYDKIEGNHIKKKNILHIGDNPKADYQGAKNFGFEALLITNPNYTINDIRSKIQR